MKPCPHCGRQIQDEAVYCRYCHRDVGVAVAPSRVAPSLSPESPVFAGWLVGGGITLATLIGATLLMGRVIGPAIARGGTIQGFEGTLRLLAISFYGATFLCAALGGAAGAWWAAHRGARDRLRAALIGASAPLPVAAILSAWSIIGAYIESKKSVLIHGSVPIGTLTNRPALIFGAALFAVGGALGAAVAPKRAVRARAIAGPDGPEAGRSGGPPGALLALALAIALGPHAEAILGTRAPSGPDVRLAAASSPNPFDIAPADCTRFAVVGEGSASLDLFGLDIGPELSFVASRRADDRWDASLTVGAKVGIALTEGAHIKAVRFVGGFGFSGTIDAELQKSAEWDGLSQEELLGLVSLDGLRSASRLGPMAALSDLFRVGGSNEQTTGLTNGGHRLPDASKQGLVVGGEFDGKLFFGTAAAFSVELKGSGKFGFTYADQDVTLQVVLAGSAAAELDSLTGSVGGQLGGAATLSYTIGRRAPFGPRSISFEATGTLVRTEGKGGSNDIHTSRTGPRSISLRILNQIRAYLRRFLGVKSMRALTGVGVSIETGASIQVQAEVDFRKHPDDVAAFSAFATAVFLASTQHVTPEIQRRLDAAGADLESRVERDGTVEAFLYGTVKGDASIDISFGTGLRNGVSVAGSVTVKGLDVAAFRDPSQGFVRSNLCRAESDGSVT